ncbi:hypothetical protein [Sporolactobacillus terrae]|nr:hypothetical protein [Sporolactobacillus terrae]
MKLSRITVLAFHEFRRIKYEGEELKPSNGYVLNSAYEMLLPKLNVIDWQAVNKKYIPNVSDNKDVTITKISTTLNMKESISQGIDDLQNLFKRDFDTDRVFKSFVVKLILFAAILDLNGELPLKKG